MKIKLILGMFLTLLMCFNPNTVVADDHLSNVLFIPGIMGSNLFEHNGFLEDELWVPTASNRINDISELYLDSRGESITNNIYTRAIIQNVSIKDVYRRFAAFMTEVVTDGDINEWSAFPYDWRQGLDTIVAPADSAPTLTLTSNRYTTQVNHPITLSWTSTNATSCVADGGWTGEKSLSGTEIITNLTLPRTVNFKLTCSNGSESILKTVSVRVIGDIIYTEVSKFFDLSFMSAPPIQSFAGARIPNNQFKYLDEEIMRLASTSKTGKVTIIGHSYGGLVAKKLMQLLESSGRTELVDKVILVGVPQLGTPSSLTSVLHGEGLGRISEILLDRSLMRGLAENMPSAYELLPHKKLFEKMDERIVTFSSGVESVFPSASQYSSGIRDYESLRSFLNGEDGIRDEPAPENVDTPNVLKENLLEIASSSQASYADWRPPSGVEVFEIVGWSSPTTVSVDYTKHDGLFSSKLDHSNSKNVFGDGTVVLESATDISDAPIFFDINSYNKENETNYSHANLLEPTSVQNLIKNILIGDQSLPAYMSTTSPKGIILDDLRYTYLAMLSPVAVNIYDENGNHLGLATTTATSTEFAVVDENIPNSSYDEVGEGKYLFFPTSGIYAIDLLGTGTGTFTLKLSRTQGNDIVETFAFTDIPVSTSTVGRVKFDEENVPFIEMERSSGLETVYPDGHVTPVPTNDNLVGYWKFDESGGTEAFDQTSNNNDGALIGGPMWGSDSTRDSYLKFGLSDNYVSVPDNDSLDIGGSFTVSAWIKPESPYQQLQTLFVKGAFEPGGRNYSLAINYGWSMSGVWAQIAGCNFYPLAALSKPIQIGEWQKITLRYDEIAKTRDIFLNGELVNRSLASTCSLITNNQPLSIGGVTNSGWSGFSKFVGGIDDLMIYDVARGDSAI